MGGYGLEKEFIDKILGLFAIILTYYVITSEVDYVERF